MSAIDWVLLAIVAVSALFGLMRGFVGVLASLAAWVLAGWAAFRFGAEVALMLASDGAPGPGQLLAGYALSFLVVLLAVGLVGWVVRKLRELLPRVRDDALHRTLLEMLAAHERNIESAEQALTGRTVG